MYSWEIQQLLKAKNYLITVKDYIRICDESPQINWVKYDNFNEKFIITTDDKYKFEFKVRRLEK